MQLASIPSPSTNGFYVGPLHVHFYALMYLVGIACAVYIGQRRWRAVGGDPLLIEDLAVWGVPFGILGGRIYFDITTPNDVPPHWWGPIAVWDGGLGIWGGIALATAVCVWRLKRAGADVFLMMDALAPSLLVAQGIGRIGNWFNQELFGGPTSLPWGLRISEQFRPAGYTQDATFHPTFLYELVWDFALAAFLVRLGHRTRVRPGSLFALYVAGYSAFRIFEESLRIDSSEHFLGLRLNFYVASAGTLAGLIWFCALQRRGTRIALAADTDRAANAESGTPDAEGADSTDSGATAADAGPETADTDTDTGDTARDTGVAEPAS
jgi:prolipoprotein diacylglyceryl transferase